MNRHVGDISLFLIHVIVKMNPRANNMKSSPKVMIICLGHSTATTPTGHN